MEKPVNRGPLGIRHRWWVLLFIVLNILSVFLIAPVRPHIQVAPENVTEHPLFTLPVIGDFYLTNTLIMLVLVMLVIIGLAWGVRQSLRDGSLVPKGIAGAFEALIEVLYNLTESSAGRYAKTIFPWFATIVIFVLVGNLMKLTPIVETFGLLHPAKEGGHPIQQLWPGAYTLMPGEVHEGEQGYMVTPFFRGIPTDLNFTFALALISVFMTQVVGVRAQGMRYFLKFFNVTNLFKKPFFGAMDFLVGLLELISELSKVLSFAFRLFGNMFAGAVLLFLVGSLIPVFLQSFVVLFEVFVGLIQAFVFGMLTMVFMAQATQGHGEEHEEGAH
ncbi:MAG TPA: F0F1 ATP synthase subunit A [Anaerolinea thermolimosa]|uniref:ATP synthase subunit a n=1 Tax=Anaerolinea thermolimosa TaxID=229919 RepID=A0A3D1JHA1_9CHLR|nr:F0F1 ATP synthase subunit A [Anaerolinea thermolimosa]GAP05821.1 ATP synthase F0 subcomplex A subunit [Anaerolinea thermolimosa]HCE17617.1 F0F1 ATP synthase subunit A [Anaerolinea thermolimosa]